MSAVVASPWSIINPNPSASWMNHTYHPQVWYHSLEDIHTLWNEGFFDYVFDSRGLDDIISSTTNATLEGWETLHIPGSYPLHIAAANMDHNGNIHNASLLTNVTSTGCRDSRIYVPCWLGGLANQAAQTLIELGFTQVYAAGPEGNAGLWQWQEAGYELEYNTTFDPITMVPSCASDENEIVRDDADNVFSVLHPNSNWTNWNHTYHPQAWYHTLDEIHKLWQEDYFDYVLDARGLTDSYWNNTPNSTILLEGWESVHIPNSYPVHLGMNTAPYETYTIHNVSMLTNFSTPACRNARIFVHCWVGALANQGVQLAIHLGFTNIHAAGPQGDAGLWKWQENGWELVYNDTFDPTRTPPCAELSSDEEEETTADELSEITLEEEETNNNIEAVVEEEEGGETIGEDADVEEEEDTSGDDDEEETTNVEQDEGEEDENNTNNDDEQQADSGEAVVDDNNDEEETNNETEEADIISDIASLALERTGGYWHNNIIFSSLLWTSCLLVMQLCS